MKLATILRKDNQKPLFQPPGRPFSGQRRNGSPGQPIFAQTIRPARDRAAQWQAIVAARANHRLCHVFENPADFLAFSLEVPYARERN